jgi:hypothetical protein
MLIVRLLAAASVTDDRIAFTNGASPQNGLGTACGPIGFELVRLDGKRDKKNRSSLELCPGVDLPRAEPEAELLPLMRKSQLEKNNASRLQFSQKCDSENWPVINDLSLPIWCFANGSFYESGLDLREHGIGLLTQEPQTCESPMLPLCRGLQFTGSGT